MTDVLNAHTTCCDNDGEQHHPTLRECRPFPLPTPLFAPSEEFWNEGITNNIKESGLRNFLLARADDDLLPLFVV